MSDTEKPAKKPGKLKKILLFGGIALVVGGGGVGAGLYASGGGGPAEDPNKPKLVAREGVSDHDIVAAELAAESGKSPDAKKFKASYAEIEENFTVNLRDTDGFVQVELGVSTFYDQRVLDAVKTHEVALKSAILMTMADQDTVAMSMPEGKVRLQRELARAINNVLEKKEGFGGIDGVYFTSFIIQ